MSIQSGLGSCIRYPFASELSLCSSLSLLRTDLRPDSLSFSSERPASSVPRVSYAQLRIVEYTPSR